MGPLGDRGVVGKAALGAGILEQAADYRLIEGEGGRRPHNDRDAASLGPGGDDGDGLRVASGVHQELLPGAWCGHAERHAHRLGGGGRLVEEGGVGHFEAGQVAHHRLEIEERLEPALGDLRLIGRVRGVPARVFEDVPLDDARDVAVGVSHAQEGPENSVGPGPFGQFGERLRLARGGRQIQRLAQPDVPGDQGVDQLVE